MTLVNAPYLGIERFANDRNKENWSNASDQDKTTIIRTVYQQVLGRQYIMESERLEGAESLFRNGYLSVREFVRAVAKSGLYRSKFFENCNPYHFIELNFKHLLGRAPQNKAEMLHHFTILQEEGVEAEIDSYIDSAEYQERFGEEVVPYLTGWDYSAGQQGRQFSWLMQLARGAAASVKGDTAGTNFRLGNALHQDRAVPVVSPNAKGSAYQPSRVANESITKMAKGIGQKAKVYRIEVTGLSEYRLHKRSNTVRFVPFDKLLEAQQMIHRQGGRVASVSPVN
ncbi:phycobilisome rod-core linker polypeptide [Cyanobium sp. Cruz CV13-4-11]|jgi:phycoerythrin-associated linker protein|uniref:phycobilisome rod-core linker polypeptide n=1 Tax=unclassified Cyanobium TaxID=2627006 RepID=UPI0020CC6A17|nr:MULTISPECIES: phycobilisome rod-core linker polypeptide [unclassified Cyanobium]MCP9901097.1 phycobilisome rod-core linker polypeptide [Cyanobium sp. Cruz CV11-17]MCP9920283.1 phycobilisome rod-core linker polypeptide [Cyanobium sp. Cruz CV13-4-11]